MSRGNEGVVAILTKNFQAELDAIVAESKHPMTTTLGIAETDTGYCIDLSINITRDAAAELVADMAEKAEPVATDGEHH